MCDFDKAMILITGAAGFIGFHLAIRLLEKGERVYGIDNLNDYYDPDLKQSRLELLNAFDNFRFEKLDLEDKVGIDDLFSREKFQCVINLAAQAGVRYSLVNPYAYLESNLHGFLNILEACRHSKVSHLIYASSSSVYGKNTKMPFSVHDNVDHPVSLYAATKKSNELMAHTYSHLFGLPTTGLRFFTVYGPYGRPDMALFLFTKAILEDQSIDVYNNGKMLRDFTYVDDIVSGIENLIPIVPSPSTVWNSDSPDPASSTAPYKLYNIGNNNPVKLMDFIEAIESATGKKAKKNFVPIQPGDVPATYADVQDLVSTAGFKPGTSIQEGIRKFVDWYKEYYKVTF